MTSLELFKFSWMVTSALCGQLICFSCLALGDNFESFVWWFQVLVISDHAWSNCSNCCKPLPRCRDRCIFILGEEGVLKRTSAKGKVVADSQKRLRGVGWSTHVQVCVCRWCFSVHSWWWQWWTVVCRLPVGTKDRNNSEYLREREKEEGRERIRERGRERKRE